MLLTHFDEEEVIKALENNMAGKFAYLPGLTSKMDVREENDMLLINSHLNADMFNIICKAETVNLTFLRMAIDIFITEGIPFAWWTGFKEEPSSLTERLAELNLRCTEREIGMARTLDDLPTTKYCSELKIAIVDSPSRMQDFIKVLSRQIPKDAEAMAAFYKSTQDYIFDKDNLLKLFVGYYDMTPVATSALFCHSGVAGIWDIITLPEVRGRGIGSDMTLHALHYGKTLGYKIGVLSASDDGQHVYRRLGFESLQDIFVYNLISIEDETDSSSKPTTPR